MALHRLPIRAAWPGLSALALSLALTACATRPSAVAVAELQPTRGNAVSGSLRFEQHGDLVRVSGEVHGLPPGTEHGFHVHEKGDCSSGDGVSAGGHYNPTGSAHGRYGMPPHHVGDLPSLMADGAGVAKVMFDTRALSLVDPSTGIVGKGLIVHRDPDDFKTQPTGNSGPRLACGVIVRR